MPKGTCFFSFVPYLIVVFIFSSIAISLLGKKELFVSLLKFVAHHENMPL